MRGLQVFHADLKTRLAGMLRVEIPDLGTRLIESNLHETLDIGFLTLEDTFEPAGAYGFSEVGVSHIDGEVL